MTSHSFVKKVGRKGSMAGWCKHLRPHVRRQVNKKIRQYFKKAA